MDKLKELSKLSEYLLTDLFWPAYKQALIDRKIDRITHENYQKYWD